MLGVEDKDGPSNGNRKTYFRSASWTDRLPRKSNTRPQSSSKARACLPPLQPLSITRPNVEEWPKAGLDDLGIWPNPPTPGVRIGPVKTHENSNSEQQPKEFEFKKDKLAFFDKECSRILNHVYLGSDSVAKNREILREKGITHVLNCVGFVCPEYFKNDLVYMTLWLEDRPSEDITSILYDVFDYFEDVREQGGRVFVHCCRGVSRSNSLVIAYLMWKEGQNFEDAFHRVKAARGVTNPNMGFACQLLQAQKRVHVEPASPNSVLRMYRMAPHSPYDPLHLVPKMLNQPGASGLDSRGAFVIHVPSAIYVWIGKSCMSMMSDHARAAAFQVVRYESAQGPVMVIKEGEEPSEFWDAFGIGGILEDNCSNDDVKVEDSASGNHKTVASIHPGIGQRKVTEYDLDFDIFHKAIAGGVVPPFALSGTEAETCLPARENGWSILRWKFAGGNMKEVITLSKLSCDSPLSNPVQDMNIDCCEDTKCSVSPTLLSSPQSGIPDSLFSSVTCSPNGIGACKGVEHTYLSIDPLFSPKAPNSFPSFLVGLSNCSSTSPSLSPSTSDHSRSFTFSPSSSHWSDLSNLSAQPSPTGLESRDLCPAKEPSLEESACFCCREPAPSPEGEFSANHAFIATNTCLQCRGTSPSIAWHLENISSPRIILHSADHASHIEKNLERSWSFSMPDLADNMTRDIGGERHEEEASFELNREEPVLDASALA